MFHVKHYAIILSEVLMIKLIATDMDHTLLKSDSTLPNSFEETVSRVFDENIQFVLASGRTLFSIKKKVQNINLPFSFISDNGAIIEHNNEIIHFDSISKENLDRIISVLEQAEQSSVVLCGINTCYVKCYSDEHKAMLYEYYPVSVFVDDLRTVEDDIVKVTLMNLTDAQQIFDEQANPSLGNDFNTVVAGKIWIDVMNQGINKGKALSILRDSLNIDASEAMAFGDYNNDLEMLKSVDHSYAMGNAVDVIKEAASQVIGTNDEEAVITIINERLNSK